MLFNLQSRTPHERVQGDYAATRIPKELPRKTQATQTTTVNKQDYIYFKFPYVSDKVDRQVKKIFKQVDLPVRLCRQSFTLRNALAPKKKTPRCTMKDCTLRNDLCFKTNCVYKLTCDKCSECYIGSSIRTFHQRLKEHLKMDEKNYSSVAAHRRICKASFTSRIIATERDPVMLRFKEALLINQHNAKINSRNEREELQHLIV